MKTLTTPILAFVSAMVFAVTAFADTWIDPDTGIEWTYKVSGGKASVGSESWDVPAIPKTTTIDIAIYDVRVNPLRS